MNWFQEWALTLAVFLPAVGMVIVLLIPKAEENPVKVVALLATLVTLAVGHRHPRRLQLQPRPAAVHGERAVDRRHPRPLPRRHRRHLAAAAAPVDVRHGLCVIYSWNHFPEPHNPKAFLALILLLETGMNGTFVAQDLILFFIFFEIVLLPMFFMIGVWGGPNREYASIKFFLFTLFGSALMLLSFLALFFL